MEDLNSLNKRAHKISLSNRRNLSIGGVVDVLSFDVKEVLLETELGMLMIKGADLHISRLTLDDITDASSYSSPKIFFFFFNQQPYHVSHTGSAYSTMTLQKDGRIGFFYEEEPGWYSMVYVPISVDAITNGLYFVK